MMSQPPAMSPYGNFSPATANISVILTESIGVDGGAVLSVDFCARAVSDPREATGHSNHCSSRAWTAPMLNYTGTDIGAGLASAVDPTIRASAFEGAAVIMEIGH